MKHIKDLTWTIDIHNDTSETIIRDQEGFIVADLEVDYSEAFTAKRPEEDVQIIAKLISAAPELFQMVRDLKDCIKRLTQDELSQHDRDTEAQWEGEAHELLQSIDPDYYQNANEVNKKL